VGVVAVAVAAAPAAIAYDADDYYWQMYEQVGEC